MGTWLEALPDTRFAPFIEYDKRFLMWWGLLLFCCKLGSRRQLDSYLSIRKEKYFKNCTSRLRRLGAGG